MADQRPVDAQLQWLINDLLTHNTDSTRFAYFRTSHITFEADAEVPWTLDGEFGGATRRAEITNHCRAITFAVGGADEDKNRLPDKSGANRT